MIWQEFEVNLFSTITNFTTRTILIIGASDGHGKTGVPFAQFAGINALYGGNTDIVAAICGENVPEDMATFTPQQRDDLEQLGFTPSDDGVTWQRRLPWPAMSRVIWDTVQASTLRLRDIGGIESPAQLTYKAWRYPSRTPDLEHDPGDMDLHIPELGIPREH